MRWIGLLSFVFAVVPACGKADMNLVTLLPGSLRSGMVAHYTCDNDLPGQLVDSTGNGHTGVLYGVEQGEGRFGRGLHFKEGQFASVPNFPNATPSYSVALWARPTSTYSIDYITLASTESVFFGGWELNMMQGQADWGFHFGYPVGGDSGQAYNHVDSPRVVPGVWTHLAGVVDDRSMTMSLYVDGDLIERKSVPGLIQRGSSTLYFGRWAMDDRFFAGDMDDMVIYSRALSSDEIRLLQTSPVPDPS